MDLVGKWAFIVGLAIAIIAAFVTDLPGVGWGLAVLGLIVGLLNVGAEQTQKFLLAAIALMMSATALHVVPWVGDVVTRILGNVVSFIAAAVLIVAVKAVLETARTRA